MPRLKILHEGVIYKNPRPGHQAISAFYCNALAISDQELICCTKLGQALYSIDQRLTIQRSIDGGRTWTNEGLVRDPQQDSPPRTYGLGMISRFSDGSMAVVAFRHPAVEKSLDRHNPETGGLPPTEYCLLRSEDDGRTWSEPEPLPFDEPGADLPSPIVELQDGRWFLPCVVWKAWDDPRPLHIKGYGVFSSDKGKTWGDRVDFPSASDKEKMYSHGRYIRMKDGRLCVLQWCQTVGGQENLGLYIEVGDPTGRQWTTPQPTGIPGESSWIGDLGNGLMVASYSFRIGPKPGIKAVLSQDGGKTWDLDSQLQLWDSTGREYLGLVHPPKYPASHDNVAYGMPVTTVLPAGDVLVQWWCTEACVTHCRCARLQVK